MTLRWNWEAEKTNYSDTVQERLNEAIVAFSGGRNPGANVYRQPPEDRKCEKMYSLLDP